MVAACSQNGILGCLATEEPQRMRQSLEYITANTTNPFAVNLFLVPDCLFENQPPVPLSIRNKLNEFRRELQIPVDPPLRDVDSYKQEVEAQIELIKEFGVKVVIFTFGIPSKAIVDELHQNGVQLIGSATTVKEAMLCQIAGLDGVVLQGSEAGGHRTSPILPEYGDHDLDTLITAAKKEVTIPLIAAGGIMDKRAIENVIALGATAVSIGTLFLGAEECSTPTSHRDLLYKTTSETKTVMTRIYTGRPARMIPNRFFNEISKLVEQLPEKEREIPWNFYARDIFGKSARTNNPDLYVTWSGKTVNHPNLRRTRSAKEIIEGLRSE